MDKKKIKIKEVQSANRWYLFYGILFVIMIMFLEIAAIRQFFISPIGEAITLLFLLQLPCLLCLLFTTMIGDWIHRTKFNLYYCRLENGIDINYIKENYSVKKINANGVLFVDKKNSHNFYVWSLLQGYDSLYKMEVELFS